MPYINKERANALLKTPLGELFDAESVGGDLNFAICTLMRRFLETRDSGGCEGQPRYRDMEDVMGAMHGASQEFYRLVVEPYEDHARCTGADPFRILEMYARKQRDGIAPLESH